MGGLTASTTRRAAARTFAALGLLPALAAVPDAPAAKKGKNRKGKNRCKERARSDPRATCPDACPETCAVCAERSDATPLCADGLATISNAANACDSDNDCIGRTDSQRNLLPYCVIWENTEGLCSRVTAPCS